MNYSRIYRKRRMLAEMRLLEEEEARRAISSNGRSISPVISNDNNLFDIHTEEIEEGFGVVSDRKKDRKKLEEKEEEEEEEFEEFGVERRRKPRDRRVPDEGWLTLLLLADDMYLLIQAHQGYIISHRFYTRPIS